MMQRSARSSAECLSIVSFNRRRDSFYGFELISSALCWTTKPSFGSWHRSYSLFIRRQGRSRGYPRSPWPQRYSPGRSAAFRDHHSHIDNDSRWESGHSRWASICYTIMLHSCLPSRQQHTSIQPIHHLSSSILTFIQLNTFLLIYLSCTFVTSCSSRRSVRLLYSPAHAPAQ